MKNNPWVLRDMAERLLEANNRSLWKTAKKSEIDLLKELVSKSERFIEEDLYTQS